MDNFELPKMNEEQQPEEQNNQNVEQINMNNNVNNNEVNTNEVNNNMNNNQNIPSNPEKNDESAGNLIIYAIINIFIIFGLNYVTVKVNTKALIAIPICIVVLTFITALKHKNKNDYPTGVLLGGIASGIITFLLSFKLDQDLFTHFAIITSAMGVVGYTISATLNSLIVTKNKTGVQILGPILYFVLLIGGGYFVYQKYPNKVNKYLYYNKVEIVASTEEEFISETLKLRYDLKFICGEELKPYVKDLPPVTDDDITAVQPKITKERRLMTIRYCTDENKNLFQVLSIEYNKTKNQYVVRDTYINKTKIDVLKEDLVEKLKNELKVDNVKIYMYAKDNCLFYGDCVTDDYFENMEKETNIDNQYNKSKELELKSKLLMEPLEFVNKEKFKFQIAIYKDFDGTPLEQLQAVVNNTLNVLNNNGYENTSGYVIEVFDVNPDDLQKKLLVATGEAGDSFANPVFKE